MGMTVLVCIGRFVKRSGFFSVISRGVFQQDVLFVYKEISVHHGKKNYWTKFQYL